MSELLVTVVVVPRERFSHTQDSLESLYENTHFPFKLVYVDGKSPLHIKRYLQEQAKQKGFHLIRTEHYLAPNHARNMGLSHADTKYVVFIDNDVIVKPGWLESLVQCAEETGAWAVGPLTLQGSDFKTIHMAGGTIELREKQGKRWMIQKRPYMRLPLAKVESQLERGPTQLLEFHCMLTRKEAFEQVGLLDESFLSMCEEDDFCMAVAQSGNTIYFEPNSVVSYLPPPPLVWSDLPFFFLRWSSAWCQVSMDRCRSKWNLTEDSPFLKHTEYFVRDHAQMAFTEHWGKPNYPVKKLILTLMKKLMNWKASNLLRA